MASPSDYINTVQSMYLSYYGRFADKAGMDYWTYMLNANGGNLDTIIQAFGTSAEATALYPTTLTTAQKVTNLYNTLFGRDPDASGLVFYTNLIGSGQATLIDIAKRIFDGATAQDANMLANKVNVANTLTPTVGAQANYTGAAVITTARELMKTVTADVATVNTATNTAANAINHAATTGTSGVVTTPTTDTTGPTVTAISSGFDPNGTYIQVTANEAGTLAFTNTATSALVGNRVALSANSATKIYVPADLATALTTGVLGVMDVAGNTTIAANVFIGKNNVTTADTLTGTASVDYMFGFDDNDIISGGASADVIHGGAGNDTYLFNTGDVVTGESVIELATDLGDDTLKIVTSTDMSLLNAGADFISTGSAIEQILITSGQTATFTGAQLTGNAIAVNATAAGAANLVVNATAGATVTLANLTFTAFGGNNDFDSGTDTITLNGSTGAETLTGSSIADTITGGLGADIIDAGTGLDTVVIAAGDSTATVSQGTTTVASTVTGFDAISNLLAGNGAVNSETLNVAGTAALYAPASHVNSADITTYTDTSGTNVVFKSHAVTDGIVTFYSTDDNTTAITLSAANMAGAVAMLLATDLGNAGATAAFVVGTDTFVYTQSGANAGTGDLVKLVGVSADALITTNGTGANDLFIA